MFILDWFKKSARKKEAPLTIEFVESVSGVKLTYPNQKVSGNMNDDKYKELRRFGCSDVWDDNSRWMHRDCFSGREKGVCEKCNYYPIVQEYNKNNNIPNGVETDFIKAFMGFDIKNNTTDENVHE